MDEMNVLAATRDYLVQFLSHERPDSFLRLLLYLFIREEDVYMTKVAYSGTAYYSIPTSPLMRDQIQDLAWLSLLGDNKTEYLRELSQHNIFGVDSITLLNAGGSVVGVDALTGDLLAITSPAPTATPQNIIPPNTDMSSTVSMTLYLCAIIVPLVVFVMIIIWWIARKLRFDVEWTQPRELDPENLIWHTSHRFDRCISAPVGSLDDSREQSCGLEATKSRHIPSSIVTVQAESMTGTTTNAFRKSTKHHNTSSSASIRQEKIQSPQLDTEELKGEERSPLKEEYKPSKTPFNHGSVRKSTKSDKKTTTSSPLIEDTLPRIASTTNPNAFKKEKKSPPLDKECKAGSNTKIENPPGRNVGKNCKTLNPSTQKGYRRNYRVPLCELESGIQTGSHCKPSKKHKSQAASNKLGKKYLEEEKQSVKQSRNLSVSKEQKQAQR